MRDERQYVVGVITAFLNDSGSRWDWNGFTSCSLRDVELERIRRCAAAVELPIDAAGKATLLELLEQAELVNGDDPTKPKPWQIEAGVFVGLLVGAVLWWSTYLPGASLFSELVQQSSSAHFASCHGRLHRRPAQQPEEGRRV